MGLLENFEVVTFEHISQEDSQLADALSTLASMFELNQNGDIPLIKIQRRDQPANCQSIEEEPDRKPWYHDVKMYIKSIEYPPGASKNDKRTLRRLAMSFFLNGEVLYKKNHDMVLLRCVDVPEAQ